MQLASIKNRQILSADARYQIPVCKSIANLSLFFAQQKGGGTIAKGNGGGLPLPTSLCKSIARSVPSPQMHFHLFSRFIVNIAQTRL